MRDNPTVPISGPNAPLGSDQLENLLAEFARLRHVVEELREFLLGKRKDYLTVGEVAELCGRSDYTVRRWIEQKRIDATRVSGTGPKGRLLIPRAELKKLVIQGLSADVLDVTVAD